LVGGVISLGSVASVATVTALLGGDQLNALWQLALGMGLLPLSDETENLVRQRWARLKGDRA